MFHHSSCTIFGAAPVLGPVDWEPIATFESSIFSINGRSQRFALRVSEGHQCFGYRDGSEVVCYLWTTSGQHVPLPFGMSLTIPTDEVHVWDCRTRETHRRRGLYRRGLLSARGAFPSSRILRIISHKGNLASETAILGAGFVPQYRLRLQQVGFLKFAAQAKVGERIFSRPRWVSGPLLLP